MGKSGSFFFFSHDTNFLIKTMTMNDFNAFMYLFKFYFEHINQYPESLIARIYGVYSIQMDEMGRLDIPSVFIVFANMLTGANPLDGFLVSLSCSQQK